jgi:hypothetical protein
MSEETPLTRVCDRIARSNWTQDTSDQLQGAFILVWLALLAEMPEPILSTHGESVHRYLIAAKDPA